MKSYQGRHALDQINSRQSTVKRRGRGARALVAAAAIALLANASPTFADVTGEGDVTPVFPILPEFGGVVAADIVVGGSGTDLFTTMGILVIDVPAFTLPLVSDNGYIGNLADGIGQATVTGFLSEWSVNEKMSVGVNGLGYLTVSGGAVVRSNLTGTNSDPDAFVGELLGSQGYVTLTGSGSQWQNDNIVVGHRGTGTVVVQSGAWLRTEFEAVVGEDFSTTGTPNSLGRGTVEVTGDGSRWNIGEELTVGDQGRGDVQVLAGGEVRAGRAVVIGNAAGSYGKAVVSGQGSQLWAERTLVIGAAATAQAEVYVIDLGILRADTSITIGEQAFVNLASGGTIITPTIASAGVIRGAGTVNGTVTNDGDIRNAAGIANTRERLLFTGDVTNNDNIESVGGEMEFKGNVTNNSPDGDIYGKDAIFRFMGAGGLTNNSRVTLDDSIVESTNFINNAALAVVASETSTILGNLTLGGSSILEMELGDDYSQLWVTGDANVGGTLSLSLDPSYKPQTGDSFEILRSDALSGIFASEIMTPNPGMLWDVSYLNDSVFVTFGGAAPPASGADFNGDGIVNGDDLAIWSTNFGYAPPPAATHAMGDANGDGFVDGIDFMIIQQQLGGPPPAVPAVGGSLAAVPEPSALLLGLASLGLPLAMRRRKQLA